MHRHGGHVRARGDGADGQVLVEIQVRAVRFVRKAQHAVVVRDLHDGAHVRADAVIRGIVDEDGARVRVRGDGLFHLRDAHAERDAEAVVTVGVDVDGRRAAQNQRPHDAAVHVARQNDLVAAPERRQHHALHGARRAADHQKRVRRAERLGGELFRVADDGHGVAQVVQRLHRVDVDGDAFFAQKLRELGVAAPALVAGHVERHNAHALEPLQRLVDGRAFLRKHRNHLFQRILGSPRRGAVPEGD